MAAIKNPTLIVEPHSGLTVKVTVKYTLFQFPLEYWAKTLYQEDISLFGDDNLYEDNPMFVEVIIPDEVIDVFPTVRPISNPHQPLPPVFQFERTRVKIVSKEAMNEDPGLLKSNPPIRLRDEVYAIITLRTVANPVTWPPIPQVVRARTNTVTGIWG
ncbi:hypothetical protein [Candidatus Electronema sp. JM]|uniref:hypothetical protein n=1 Tax=Candidatus Electronema sp. JM TaxID=3401571 RepID=UPI003AA90FF7